MRKALACLFIAFYVYTTALWLCGPSQIRGILLTPTRDAFNYLGLWQEFAVFGPSPRKQNLHVTATITYADGTKGEWSFPRIEKCNYWEKMFGERTRKFGIEHLCWPNKSYLCSHFAWWLTGQQRARGLRPTHIDLVKHWVYTPPPEKGLGKPPLSHSNTDVFYSYNPPKEITQ